MYDLFDTFFNPWYDDSEYSKKAPKQRCTDNTESDEDRYQRICRWL
ncbi:MAG: hypothetical protein ACLRTZ_01355 [Agathobacter sp.]